MLQQSKTDDSVHTPSVTVEKETEKWCWEIKPLNRGNEGKKREKREPVQTDFTDDVISKSNAANEGT